MNEIEKNILLQVADLHDIPEGAYNIRLNGKAESRRTTDDIQIIGKTDKPGIDIIIKPGTKNQSVHIPVVVSQAGLTDLVYNDFFIGEDADVVIIAGCGLHSCGDKISRHDGIHTFYVGKNAKLRYVEKHYGEGDGTGERVLNPTTVVEIADGGSMEMETTQIKGVDSTVRITTAKLSANARFVVKERLMTHGAQTAVTTFDCELNGSGSHTHIVSRSVARDKSKQEFVANIYGNAECYGRSECDAIIMNEAVVSSKPGVEANHPLASLAHEAAIGKIAGEQLTKLMTLGLAEAEAEEKIIAGFLK